eukprot:8517518-Heterocapsa_arctica.AAC.1
MESSLRDDEPHPRPRGPRDRSLEPAQEGRCDLDDRRQPAPRLDDQRERPPASPCPPPPGDA